MNTTENNKLIAEFMGFEILYSPEFDYIELSDNEICLVNLLEYNSSWDWLMPVVEKIESLNFVVQIHLGSCFIKSHEQFIATKAKYISKAHEKTKIEAVYNACIEFIKWYNEQKK